VKLIKRQEKDIIFRIGVILIVFWSIIIGVFHIGVFYLFGIPIFGLLLGIILVWYSSKSSKTSLLFSLLPIPIIVILFFTLYQLNKGEPETFLVSENFRGDFVVFYGESCGQEKVYENGRRIHRIPSDGILITRFEETKGFLDEKLYFVASNGSRTKIPQKELRDFNFEEKPSKDVIFAFRSWGLSIWKPDSKYTNYLVSTYREYETDQKEKLSEKKQFAEESAKKLVKCRKGFVNN